MLKGEVEHRVGSKLSGRDSRQKSGLVLIDANPVEFGFRMKVKMRRTPWLELLVRTVPRVADRGLLRDGTEIRG